ncbi:MAG: hypothetical protein AAGF90_01820 [Pseudomonadota bacterium]
MHKSIAMMLLFTAFLSACSLSGPRPEADPNGLKFGRSPLTAGAVAR